MLDSCHKIEEIMETLEVLADPEAVESIEISRRQIKKGECIRGTVDDVDKILG
jgi:PHD/YefM family antitoxin component YafN of YafNO toxin-antitoxin module